MSAAGLVLAAGAGSRVGVPKALLHVGGVPFGECIVSTLRACGIDRIVVVLGHGAEEARPLVPVHPGVTVVLNPRPEDGLLSSVQVALRDSLDRSHFLLWPVDHPLVSPGTVRSLIAAGERAPVVIPTHGGRGGHPAVFTRDIAHELLGLPAGATARDVLGRDPSRVLRVPVDDPGVVEDVDTPDDVRRIGAVRRPI